MTTGDTTPLSFQLGPTYMPARTAGLTAEKISLCFTGDKTIIFPRLGHMLAAPGVELAEMDSH